MSQYVVILNEQFTRDIQVLPENNDILENEENSDGEGDRTDINDGAANIMLGTVEAVTNRQAVLGAAEKFGFSADKLTAHELARNINKLRNDVIQAKQAMIEKGYDPMRQIVKYIVSDDPIHITSYKNTRENICAHNRYAILEEIVSSYLEQN